MVHGPHGGADTPAHMTPPVGGAEPDEQGTLFPDSFLAGPAGVTDQLLGYRGAVNGQDLTREAKARLVNFQYAMPIG